MQNQAAKDDPIAARKAMLDRVVSDFTFKANQTDDQKTLWNSIDQHFSIFHSEVLYQISVSKPNALVSGCPHRLRVPDQSMGQRKNS